MYSEEVAMLPKTNQTMRFALVMCMVTIIDGTH